MVIFDFDLTLVDTQPVEILRKARRWGSVMAQAPKLKVYDGIHKLIRDLDACDETLAIVTKSPDMVPRFFVKQYKWPVDIVLGHHQVNRRKPDPEALLMAMRKAGAKPGDTFHVGDQPEDTEASRAAGVTAIGAGWGLTDIGDLTESKPDHLFISVEELRVFLVEALQLAPPATFRDTGKTKVSASHRPPVNLGERR